MPRSPGRSVHRWPRTTDFFRGAGLKFYRALDRLMEPAPEEKWRELSAAAGADTLLWTAGTLVAGRYVLEDVIGAGFMGRVWAARDTLDNARVAVKELRVPLEALAGKVESGRRTELRDEIAMGFKQEFYTMVRLQHPMTPRVFDSGTLVNGRFITMELIDGDPLEQELMVRGTLRLEQVYSILIQLATVLGFIHSKLFVHCDIKTDNILMLGDGRLKLLDFGLMHQLGTPAGNTLRGTPYYMAPEIPRGGVLDARTDLYALGVLAFRLLTGRYPFDAPTPLQLLRRHIDTPAPRVSAYEEVPDGVDACVARLLEKDPRDRYPGTAALLKELSQLSGRPVVVRDYEARASYLNCAQMVGRAAEQETFGAVLEDLQRGQGRALFVSAPAGVGKSRLMRELRLSAQLLDLPFVRGQCRPEGQTPLDPIVQCIRYLYRISPPDIIGPWRESLGYLIPEASPGRRAARPTKLELLAALRHWLSDLASEQPYIVCIEDLHWADSGCIEFLNELLRALEDHAVLILGTFRTDEVDRLSGVYRTIDEGLSRHVELEPLSMGDTKTLLASILGESAITPELISRLYERTSGNAFFLTETIRALIEAGVFTLDGGQWCTPKTADEVDLPRTIREVVNRRIAGLPPRLKTFCQTIALFGSELHLSVVRDLSGIPEDELFSTLDELVERQFITRNEDVFEFSHDTVREGFYFSMSEQQRRGAHRRAGDYLESQPYDGDDRGRAALLAYHHSRGTDREKAIRYLLMAGDESAREHQMLSAMEFLSEAADLIEASDLPDRDARLAETWSKIVDVGTTGHPRRCANYAEKLLELWERTTDIDAAHKQFNDTVTKLRNRASPLRRRRLAEIWTERSVRADSRAPIDVVPRVNKYRTVQAICYASMGDKEALQATIDRLLADNPEPGPFRASAQIPFAAQNLHLGRWQDMAQGARNAMQWFREHVDSVGVMYRQHWRDYVWAHIFALTADVLSGKPLNMTAYEEGLKLSKEQGFVDLHWSIELTPLIRGTPTGASSDVDAAMYQGSLARLKELGHPQMLETAQPIYLAMHWLQRRERSQSEALSNKLDFWSRRTADLKVRRYALIHRAIYSAHFLSPTEAEPAVGAALKAVAEEQSFRLDCQLRAAEAEMRLAQGRRSQAVGAAEAGRALVTEARWGPWDETTTLRVLGKCVGGSRGLQLLNEAVEVARRWDLPVPMGLAHLDASELRMRDDRVRAGEHAAKAIEQFEIAEAGVLLGRAQRAKNQAETGVAKPAGVHGE